MRTRTIISIFAACLVIAAAGCSGAAGSSTNAGEENAVASDSVRMAAPTNLRADSTHKEITLSWDMARWDDRYTFDIYRWQPGREPMYLDSVPAGVHTYADPSAAQDRYYFYAVVARNLGANISESTAQISMVALQPPPPEPVFDPLAGYLPPGAYYTDGNKQSWIQQKIEEIRGDLPYVFIVEECSNCGGIGIVTLPTFTDGKPDLTYCPVCQGTGQVTKPYSRS